MGGGRLPPPPPLPLLLPLFDEDGGVESPTSFTSSHAISFRSRTCRSSKHLELVPLPPKRYSRPLSAVSVIPARGWGFTPSILGVLHVLVPVSRTCTSFSLSDPFHPPKTNSSDLPPRMPSSSNAEEWLARRCGGVPRVRTFLHEYVSTSRAWRSLRYSRPFPPRKTYTSPREGM